MTTKAGKPTIAKHGVENEGNPNLGHQPWNANTRKPNQPPIWELKHENQGWETRIGIHKLENQPVKVETGNKNMKTKGEKSQSDKQKHCCPQGVPQTV